MKKIIFILLAIIAIFSGIIASMYMVNREENKVQEGEIQKAEVADKVTDECVDEYEELQKEQTEEANSEEQEKVSPEAIIIFEKYYKDCQHTINKQEKVKNDLVNATKQDIQEKYDSWKIKEFSKEKIVLYQEVEGQCGEHYILRDVDGMINIYKLDENGDEKFLDETDIATEYLTETDMINMENGLIVYGNENLNKLLEDFE